MVSCSCALVPKWMMALLLDRSSSRRAASIPCLQLTLGFTVGDYRANLGFGRLTGCHLSFLHFCRHIYRRGRAAC